jgi:lipoic acid synthetase
MPVLLRNLQRSVRISLRRVTRTANAILAAGGIPHAELSLVLVSDQRMRRLNARYRQKNRPTDVLAFPLTPSHPSPLEGEGEGGGLMSRPIPMLETPRPRLPSWFKVNLREGPDYQDIRRLTRELRLHTICEEARCPNVWECWNSRTATFLILGDICTRRCHYCSVTTGRPLPLDEAEPSRVAEAVKVLGLRHVVITSVNRDELPDGGAGIFAETIHAIRRALHTCTVEVLVPDFLGDEAALSTVLAARPDILNHNIETVPRLFPAVRPQGKYVRSIRLLRTASKKGMVTKSGLMVGLGERVDEVRTVMSELCGVGCSILSIGQYLQPTKSHWPVMRFYEPQEFQVLKHEGLALGFRHVEAGPLVRSSYHAAGQAAIPSREPPPPS